MVLIFRLFMLYILMPHLIKQLYTASFGAIYNSVTLTIA